MPPDFIPLFVLGYIFTSCTTTVNSIFYLPSHVMCSIKDAQYFILYSVCITYRTVVNAVILAGLLNFKLTLKRVSYSSSLFLITL